MSPMQNPNIDENDFVAIGRTSSEDKYLFHTGDSTMIDRALRIICKIESEYREICDIEGFVSTDVLLLGVVFMGSAVSEIDKSVSNC
jgi:hypothetical protein